MGHDSIPQIDHIVILMMENHSYDNRFGMLRRPGADGRGRRAVRGQGDRRGHAGPGLGRTLLVWTYDEHGGYYDHVVPPPALKPDGIKPDVPKGEKVFTGFGVYGFRVPTAIVSPYARRNYVSHEVMDHASICSLIERKWNLPAMTFRDANASPMLDMLDPRHPALKIPPKLDRPLVATDHNALKCEKTGPGVIPPPGSVTKPKK